MLRAEVLPFLVNGFALALMMRGLRLSAGESDVTSVI